MSTVVTKCSSEFVRPSEPGRPTGNIQLSWFDKVGGYAALSSLLVFDEPIVDPVESIRRAVSRALVPYYPMSGRLAARDDGGATITCTGEGVLFVVASASCAVNDLMSSPELLNDLCVHYPEEFFSPHAGPLLLMQVTEFSCGGFVVGVTWNHVVADGAGIGQFLQAVGELARGMSLPSIIPVRSDESVLTAEPQGMTVMDIGSGELTKEMAYVDLTIPWSFVTRVKAEVSSALGKPCTVFEAVLALLWQCRSRAVISDDPKSHASLVFASNVRGLVGAAGGYYGNCFVLESVVATTAEVANGDIKDVVKLIKTVKHKIEDQMKKGYGVDPVQQQKQHGYNTLSVSSWRNLGLEATDFGGGRPARVFWHAPQMFVPSLVLSPTCNGKNDGVNVVGYIVKKDHVDGFMKEIAARSARVE